jgi:acyl-CoA synthetase (AMP-forming)/AMP-acid ligase II
MPVRNRVRISDILRGYVQRGAPRTGTAIKGLVQLARADREGIDSIGLRVQREAEKHPERVAVRDARRGLSYFALNQLANRWAHWLQQQGVGPGDGVALLMENRVELLAAVIATVKLGAVGGMLNYNQRGEVLTHSIRLVGPKALIVGAECAEALESVDLSTAAPDAPVGWLADGDDAAVPAGALDMDADSATLPAGDPDATADVKAAQPAFYIFTSGTTGMPKAAVMSHNRWLRAASGVGLASLRMRHDDVFYCPLPLYHNNALTLAWGATLAAGAELYIARKFSASRFVDELREADATVFCYIGELCRYLLQQPERPEDRQHRLRAAIGNGLRPELWDAFQQRFAIPHINEFYGASEGNLVFTNSFNVPGSCGFCPLSYAVVAFDHETEQPRRDGRGYMQKVARGDVGLLIAEVSDKAPFDGYTDAKASEKKLLHDVFASGDCWFDTGDLVRDMGLRHIQFIDRVGDTFRWKGENVATTEVERAIDMLDEIDESVVYGVEVPGFDGRAGMAGLLLHEGAEFDGQRVARHLLAELPAYAVPVFVRLMQRVETTGTFKHRKVDLKKAGFDPAACDGEAVYILKDREAGYTPISDDDLKALADGRMRL